MSDPIHRLAERAGIQPGYRDIWGHEHVATPEIQRALLAAMGIACQDEAATRASLAAWEAAPWRELLPPVRVVTRGGAADPVGLRLAARDLGRAGRWRLTLEEGGGREGTLRTDALEVIERARLDDGEYLALALPLPEIEALGYHRLEVELEGLAPASMALIVCPPTCHRPPALADDRRVWGLSAQLYGVRSARNWGMGDYTDLKALVEWAAGHGAALVGVNPLHALYPHNPSHCSPYSPSSRQFLNVLYLDVEAVPDFHACPEARKAVAGAAFKARLRALRDAPQVDYVRVAAAKYRVLEKLWRCFRARHLEHDTERGRDFRRFQAEQGDDLYHLALFEALQAHFHGRDAAVWGWPAWSAEYHDPRGPTVRAWAEAHAERVEYQQYLQWLAAGQLAGAAARADELGLGIGLYQDLAVGVDRGGAETWMHRDLYAFEASVGAPPDDFNLHGQDWGLPPLIPHRLRAAAYGPFIRMLRANMRAAGALRIDHVMGLMRLYWVPPECKADQGVYVAYPLRDLLGILALESRRNRCLVIGEDLGTVPPEMRQAMGEMGILAYRLFYFEKRWDTDQAYTAPGEIEREVLVAASTHDLPTLAGFWRGGDLALRARLALFPTAAQREAQIADRGADRERLLRALHGEGLLPRGISGRPEEVPALSPELALAIHRYLARSRARVMLVQAEDLLGETEQANLPGTVDEHPNWRRKLSRDLEDWGAGEAASSLAGAMAAERGATSA
ncbi:MAG: 4-alpha-glucanotransferase [Thiobacillaceae bacterium]|jgi:(1->4)-alpha-D-glucan 1-alpha-D-glucosylmutase|nr:4-alpha-glucanotransferase [Thiobacillaceae bacterium]